MEDRSRSAKKPYVHGTVGTPIPSFEIIQKKKKKEGQEPYPQESNIYIYNQRTKSRFRVP